jgi:hypothetical protein
MRDSNYAAHPLCLGIEVGVPQVRLKKIAVPREKCGFALLSQQNDNLFVLQTLASKVETNLSRRQPPYLKQQALPIKDVLIKNNQACARSSTYSGAVYCSE